MSRPLFSLVIGIADDAFQPDPYPEIIRILRATADQLERERADTGTIRDMNGNRVGQFMTTK